MEKYAPRKTPDTEMVWYLVVVLKDLVFFYTVVSAAALGFFVKGWDKKFVKSVVANLYCVKR